MSKKFFLFATLILISFIYGCSTGQSSSDFRCVNEADCNQNISVNNNLEAEENTNTESENDVIIAEDNDDPMGGNTISYPETEA